MYMSIFYRFCRLTLLLVLFLSSCQQSPESMLSQELSSEEREWLTLFFNDIMLFESGIYTLWGAQKPVTTIPVANYSEKDMKARYEALSEAEKNKASFSN